MELVQSISQSKIIISHFPNLIYSRWIDRVEDPDEMQMDKNPSAYGEGQYIKCYGHLREFKGKHQIAATNLAVIGHPDEITFHFLECIYVHLELTKGRINGIS